MRLFASCSIGSRASDPFQTSSYPKFATIQFNTTEGYSNYHALQARAERRFSGGLTFLAAYTFSKTIGLFGDSQNPANRNDAKAVTDYDARHRFVLSTVYDLPFGRGRRYFHHGGILGALAGGWQLGNILTLQTGFPFTPVTGRDIANVGLNTRPNRIGQGTVSNPTIDRWFDASAFTNPPALTYGSSGVNILRQDGIEDLSSALSKNFVICESTYVQFRWEVFNVFNHADFAAPNANINQPTQVGRVFGASGDAISDRFEKAACKSLLRASFNLRGNVLHEVSDVLTDLKRFLFIELFSSVWQCDFARQFEST